MEMSIIIWWFPILFMIHEIEEIIFMKAWTKEVVSTGGNNSFEAHALGFVSTEAFTLAVFEEYLIIIAVTIHAWVFESYMVWMGLFCAVALHYVFHILMSILYKAYVPGEASAILLLVVSPFIVFQVMLETGMLWQSVVLWTIGVGLLFLINLGFLHKLMPKFNQFIIYRQN